MDKRKTWIIWLKASTFLALAGGFAAENTSTTPFWGVSAGILLAISVGYAVGALTEPQGELVPIRIRTRRD